VITCRIKLTFGGYWVSLLAGYWVSTTRCNYSSKCVAVLGGSGRNSSRGAASILPFAHWRVPQSLSKGRSAFQCIASTDNNLLIIRSETIFSRNEKLSK
jgi:hypothetical protein